MGSCVSMLLLFLPSTALKTALVALQGTFTCNQATLKYSDVLLRHIEDNVSALNHKQDPKTVANLFVALQRQTECLAGVIKISDPKPNKFLEEPEARKFWAENFREVCVLAARSGSRECVNCMVWTIRYEALNSAAACNGSVLDCRCIWL
jgi:hypothetical protein